MLAPMRYKTYTWPNNPKTYTIRYERQTAEHKIPAGACRLEDLGRTCRIMRGEGEFFGPNAYEEFKKLATVFYSDGPGVLFHPIWMTTSAYFTELTLLQEPSKDYVAYAFAFQEDGPPLQGMKKLQDAPAAAAPEADKPASTTSAARYHTVKSGDTLWAIAKTYDTTISALLKLNPQITNANLIFAGQKVRVA